jgi:hypothetical protein
MPAVPRLLGRPELCRSWLCGAHSWAPAALAPRFRGAPTGLALAALPEAAAAPALAVKRSSSRFFMYEEHRDDSRAKLRDAAGATEVLALTPAQFFGELLGEERLAAAAPPEPQHYHYWTSPLADVAPELLERLGGWQELHSLPGVGFGPAGMKLPADPRGPSLWAGSAGSCTQAHYDVADNVIVQLHGRKRVRCYPPAAHEALCVFPDAHPRARKSQVNFDRPDLRLHPAFATLGSPFLDVVLMPGDALAVPAFWFHHLENGGGGGLDGEKDEGAGWAPAGPSVSLNLFALSAPMMASQPIFREGRPLEGDGGGAGVAVGGNLASAGYAAAALHRLGTGLLAGGRLDGGSLMREPRAFVRRLLHSRYAALGGVGNGCSPEPAAVLTAVTLSAEEEAKVDACLVRLQHHFDGLRAACAGSGEQQQLGSRGEEADAAQAYEDAVVEIVAMHLFELWATALCGADTVEHTLRAAFDIYSDS